MNLSKSFTTTYRDYEVVDCETTTSNKGHPFDPRNKLVCYASSLSGFKLHSDPGFTNVDRHQRDIPLVGFNFKFDCHWLWPNGVPLNPIWDCQLAEHVITGQKAQYISLDECLERYGLEKKKDQVKEYWEAGVNTDEIPVPILQEYQEWDVRQTGQLFLVQQDLTDEKQKRLIYLMGEDLKVLHHIEQAGLRFDASAASAYLSRLREEVADIEGSLKRFLPVIQHGTFNFDSGDHLSCFLYGGTLTFDYAVPETSVYKSGPKKGESYTRNRWYEEVVTFEQRFKPLEGTELKKTKDETSPTITRLYQTDAPTLASLKGGKEGKSILGLLSARSEKQKLVEMLESIFNLFEKYQWQDNLIHGQYNQNVAVTGRLSSSAPNMQNFPPELDRFIISRYE